MFHPKSRQFDRQMKEMFDIIDHELEDLYGHDYPLHPSRPARGKTANPAADGLFNVGVSFSAGYGSSRGRGYVLNVHMSTLAHIPKEKREEIELKTVSLIEQHLPEFFPERELRVERDGPVFKITGDLTLGKL
ncbi:hypothetical protein [Spirochaeta dissipatitropha]